MRRIYLDHSATTPVNESALREMIPYFSSTHGNASSIHRFGQEARAALDESRARLGRVLGVKPGELYFTGSGTEADNFALKGAVAALAAEGKNHIVTTAIEHHAVLGTCDYLRTAGCDITCVGVDGTGRVDPADVAGAITPRTAIVSVMHANNEIGTVNPIREISEVARSHGVLFHTDAVQSFGKIPVSPEEEGADLCSFSAHKIYGPKGIGVLRVKSGVRIERFIHGGGQERGLRAGTENVPLAVGFAAAAELTAAGMAAEGRRQRVLRDRLRDAITGALPGILINGHPVHSLPGILSISFDSRIMEIDAEALLFNLDLAGIAASSGSACTSGSIEPSHVLLALGRDTGTASASLRFSLGVSNTGEEVDYAAGELVRIVRKIGKIRGRA